MRKIKRKASARAQVRFLADNKNFDAIRRSFAARSLELAAAPDWFVDAWDRLTQVMLRTLGEMEERIEDRYADVEDILDGFWAEFPRAPENISALEGEVLTVAWHEYLDRLIHYFEAFIVTLRKEL